MIIIITLISNTQVIMIVQKSSANFIFLLFSLQLFVCLSCFVSFGIFVLPPLIAHFPPDTCVALTVECSHSVCLSFDQYNLRYVCLIGMAVSFTKMHYT